MNSEMKRRAIAAAAVVSAGLFVATVQAADGVELKADRLVLLADAKGSVAVKTPDGKLLTTLDGYRMSAKGARTDGGVASIAKSAKDEQAIAVTYAIAGDPDKALEISATFTPLADRVHVEFDIHGPQSLAAVNGMAMRRAASANIAEQATKIGVWTRDANGGVPFEKRGPVLYSFAGESGTAVFAFDRSNKDWADPTARHCPANQIEPGHFAASYDVIVLPAGTSPAVAGAAVLQQPVALSLKTDKTYNIFEPSDSPIRFNASVTNATAKPQQAERKYWARDFSGKVVAEKSETHTLEPWEAWNDPSELPPLKSQGIYFVEVSARVGEFETFARTNISALPKYAFQADAEHSIMGLSAYFPLPTEAAVQGLLQRIGVRWSRNTRMPAEDASTLGLAQNFHSNTPGSKSDAFSNDPVAKDTFLRTQLAKADERRALYWEFGNEWNMREWKVEGQDRGQEAHRYVQDFLVPITKLREELHSHVKMMSQGIAGADVRFLTNIHKEGGWPLLDAIALHPGRGNFAPDFIGDLGDVSANGQYWNYLGAIRRFRALIAEFGDKPLFITEAYACTKPNGWWQDTYRHAAENVVLSFALAASEHVKAVDWYMLNDGVWFNQDGVDEKNQEFHFGLLNRDLSPKPSLMAYYTIARALDNATFVKWADFPNGETKGLWFDTPKGPMAILWNRADGYRLSEKSPDYASPEAWIDPWKTMTQVTLPASSDLITSLNCIGEQTTLPTSGGNVTLTLDGAPQIVYGLKR